MTLWRPPAASTSPHSPAPLTSALQQTPMAHNALIDARHFIDHRNLYYRNIECHLFKPARLMPAVYEIFIEVIPIRHVVPMNVCGTGTWFSEIENAIRIQLRLIAAISFTWLPTSNLLQLYCWNDGPLIDCIVFIVPDHILNFIQSTVCRFR